MRLTLNALQRFIVRARLAVFQGLGGDLKMASRRLLVTPMFAIFAMASLALGVGVTTAAYSVVDRICWSGSRPGIPRPGGLVLVVRADTRFAPGLVSAPDFEDLRAAQTSFSEIAASAPIYPAVAAASATEIQPGEAVDGSYFALLGVHAVIGRVIEPGDDRQATPVVVLSYQLWKSRFASDPHIVGQTVRLSGRSFEIIGVAPESFAGPVYSPATPRASRLWVPLAAAAESAFPTTRPERERGRLTAIGRMRPGVTEQRAATELAALGARLDAAYPQTKSLTQVGPSRRGWSARRIDATNEEQQWMRRFGALVLGLVALVLLVACTNLANLVLARGTTRQHELAVRYALGASRWRLVREQCAESVLVAGGGAVLSMLVLQVLIRALDVEVPLAASWMVSVQPQINAMALVTASIALLLSLVVFGLEPALQLTRKKSVREDLDAGAGNPTIPRARRQRTLLRWQAAISAGFFIIATLCIRQVIAGASHDSGVDIDRLGVATIDLYAQRWDESRARRGLQRVLEQARREPGVEAVAVSTGLPFGTTMTLFAELSTTDKPLTTRNYAEHETAILISASPDFFRTSGISILRGRGFDDRDDAAASPVVVVSESTARQMFGTADAVGRELLLRRDFLGAKPEQPVKTASIVGVAEDTDTTHFLSRRGNTVYTPFAQEYSPFVTLVVRAPDPATALGALRAAVRKADPDLAVAQAATGRAMLTGMYLLLRGLGIAALSLGAITLLLAMVGLYGVQSHILAYRTREIGVRMSLGATARQIERMALKDGYRPVLEGLVIGLFIGLAGRIIIRSVVIAPITIVDPWMLAVAPVALISAAFWACYLPARRASRVDPNVALRHL